MSKMMKVSFLITLLLSIIVIILTSVFFISFDGEYSQVKDKLFAEEEIEYHSQPFSVTTNVDIKNETKKFVKADVVISITDEELNKKINKKYGAPIKSTIVAYLNKQKVVTLSDPDKRAKLANELKDLLIEETHLDIKNVYFTGFLIQ